MNKIRIPLNNPTLVGNEIKYILDAIKRETLVKTENT
jgi:hypothetical protein